MKASPSSDDLSPSSPISSHPVFLRRFSKVLCAATLFLIFAGAQVKSTDSGLAVPDWPLSYGMLFPPMVGGVFYEHGHRMVAGAVGFLTLIFAVLSALWVRERWLKNLAWAALALVILQGVLGGLTVRFYLPTALSLLHGVIAQTFFCLTILLAYAHSEEARRRPTIAWNREEKTFWRLSGLLFVLIYAQLIVGAWMRHEEAGLALLDFPQMGGRWWPVFSPSWLETINHQRFLLTLPEVSPFQVALHLAHRGTALLIMGVMGVWFVKARRVSFYGRINDLVWFSAGTLAVQIVLGAATVWSLRDPLLTSAHVTNGALFLGLVFLILVKQAPFYPQHSTDRRR